MKKPRRPHLHINLEISLDAGSLGGGVDRFQIRGRRPKPRLAGSITIQKPVPGTGIAKVWTDPTTKLKYICASGFLDAPAATVWAIVYPGNVAVLDQDPPTSNPNCKNTTPGSTGKYPWQFGRTPFNLLPIDTCVSSGKCPHTLGVWAMFDGDSAYTSAPPLPFDAICSMQTDCDTSYGDCTPLVGAGYPVLSGDCGGQPPLLARLRMKTGRFVALPEVVRFTWSGEEQGWTWVPEQADCGRYTILPMRDWFVLYTSVSTPPLLPARAGDQKPLHLLFEVMTASASGQPEGFLLDVVEGGGS